MTKEATRKLIPQTRRRQKERMIANLKKITGGEPPARFQCYPRKTFLSSLSFQRGVQLIQEGLFAGADPFAPEAEKTAFFGGISHMLGDA